MSHVPGHFDKVALKSFGVLLPKLLNDKSKSIGKYKVIDGVVQFPILFAPPLQSKGLHGKQIGFQPYLIPWETDKKEYYVIASDIEEWPDHLKCEKNFNSAVKKSKYAKPNESLNLEHHYNDFDTICIDLDLTSKFDDTTKSILKKTSKYLKTSSFKTVYFNNGKLRTTDEVVRWIVENTVPLTETGFIWSPGSLTYEKTTSND